MKFWKRTALCILALEVLGNASGLLTFFSLEGWYDSLERPPGTPPNGVFGPVWLVLYALMGVALSLVLDGRNTSPERKSALSWFGIQFGLNLAWTPIFFGLRQMTLALIVFILLFGAVGLTLQRFQAVRPLAAALLWPYFLWLAYALYLNVGFVWLNR
ncbi:MAG: TspO/MBR family protein [Verrucomicrobiota bacterium]